MSHFYASIPRSARKTVATARGHKSTGITVRAASWAGAVEVEFYYDETTDRDMFRVVQTQHMGRGDYKVIAEGVVGEALTTLGG